ncbi:MAG: hypothetical protein Q9162_006689 [Coniocarpon cinnabarinum]
MQSNLQYRRIGRQIQAQVDGEMQKYKSPHALQRRGHASSFHGDQAGPSTDSGLALEKDQQHNASRPVDASNRHSRRESSENQDQPLSKSGCGNNFADGYDSGLTRPDEIESKIDTDSHRSIGTVLGHNLRGVEVKYQTHNEGAQNCRQAFVVGFENDTDPINPQNWRLSSRFVATANIAAIGAVVGVASSIDSSALQPAAASFHVSEVVESLATGIFLAGFGAGSLLAGPISETVGRNPVYISTLGVYMIWIMACGLAPNIGSQLAFRFLAGVFASTPLTCAGGSIADLWNPLERGQSSLRDVSRFGTRSTNLWHCSVCFPNFCKCRFHG